MKIFVLFLFIVAFVSSSLGVIEELDSENADRDLTSFVTVLTHTPNASSPMLCQAYIVFGDGSKDLSGAGGFFQFVMTIDGQTVQASPEIATFGTEVRASIWTSQFPVPANAEVVLQVKSPNADTDVDVTASIYDVFPLNITSGIVESDVQLIEGSPAKTYIESRTLRTADYFIFGTDPVELLDSGGSAGTSASELVDDFWNKDISGIVASDFAGAILNAIFARWNALTTTDGLLETDMKKLDGSAVKSTNGNIHALPGNI